MKINSESIKEQYKNVLESYMYSTKKIGLWDSEKHVFKKYVRQSDRILDLGCGTGRTTFPLDKIGYTNILGVDLTPEMIAAAKDLNEHFNSEIDFRIGDATNLEFQNSRFDVVFFSYNGLMSIPNLSDRDKALKEISRVLDINGVFIFTTHDRERDQQYSEFWNSEQIKWKLGIQDPTLHEFGDLIARSKDHSQDVFVHIPNQSEVMQLLEKNAFKLIETFYRSDNFEESESVKSNSGECRFWIAKK